MERIEKYGLQIGSELHDVLVNDALPGSGVDPEVFFAGLADLVAEYGPRNADLLEVRDSMQLAIDDWHRARSGQPLDAEAYRVFLVELGYLVPEGPDFEIDTANVDPEIRSIPGPQLVVPVTNARYALNAANARWGSLYDALYGTDAMGDLPPAGPYNSERGNRVIAWARTFLDDTAPLATGSHADATGYSVVDGSLHVSSARRRPAWPTQPFSSATSVTRRVPHTFCSSTTDWESRSSSIRTTASGRRTRRVSPTSFSRRR